MKYLENNDTLGIMPADDAVAGMIMENLGISQEEAEVPNLIAVDDTLFALSPELTVIDDSLCIRLEELDESLFESVKDDPELTEFVEYDDDAYLFEHIVEHDGDVYVTLIPEHIEEPEGEDDFVMELNGVQYSVTDDEDTADSYAFLQEDEDDGELYLVDD